MPISGAHGISGSSLPPGQIPPNTTYSDQGDRGFQYLRPPVPQRMLPPQPLSEYQKFVAATTGEVLPIFGEDLFRNVPSTFAPLDRTPVPPDYVIAPGDEIRIRVWGQVNFRANLHVDPTGNIYIPQIGEIQVAGIHYADLNQRLRSAVGKIYRNFDLTADMGQISAIQVYVSGRARRPGVYTISSLSTLADAIFATGGPAIDGSMRNVQLRRNGSTIATFDLYRLLIDGDKSKDVKLQSGDLIYIPPSGSRVAVIGSVHAPAIFEVRPGETIGDALRDAGGPSVVAEELRISVERISGHQSRNVFETAFDPSGLATPIDDGDIIRIFSIIPSYRKTVTLRGNTANPGRYAWHPGMRLSELIPDRDALITRAYWWKRAMLGLPAPEFQPAGSLLNLHQPTHPVDLRQLAAQSGLPTTAASSLTPQQLQTEQALAARGMMPNTSGTSASGTAAGTASSPQAAALLAQSQLSGPNGPVAPQREGVNSNASVASELTQNSTQNTAGQTPRTEVHLIAPEIDWNYAVIERMDPTTLRNLLIPFDLGRLVLQHDQSQNLELQPGDVVTIFSQADIHVPLEQQTKYVRLEGEFIHAGVYSVRPGETLRELVRRAGGFSSRAYLYGSEFTRESTRILQQRRIDEYVENLQMQIERNSLQVAASPAAIAGGAAAQLPEQQLLAQLRKIRATGRIVLELNAGSTGAASLPDITLEDGDRFVVPPLPATVNVVGAVYDQSSFLYKLHTRTGDYLRLAGGPDRDADAKHAFVIRADGSVVSRSAENGIWGNTFDALRIYPGDTIVVPEKTFKPSALTGFLDWSQLFSQFALGAAALAVIQ